MKHERIKIRRLAALLLAAACFTACSSHALVREEALLREKEPGAGMEKQLSSVFEQVDIDALDIGVSASESEMPAAVVGGTENEAHAETATEAEAPALPSEESADAPELPEEKELLYYDSDARLDTIPSYQGITWISLNMGNPVFSAVELAAEPGVHYSETDSMGRCGVAWGILGQEGVPSEPRQPQTSIKPTGWQSSALLAEADAENLYQRCHLIAYAFTGDEPDYRNMVTGTRQLNLNGMKPFENAILYYINKTGNHVAYRVTPLYRSGELVPRGVQLEAFSVEDNGGSKEKPGICFNVYIYNNQLGYTIDYTTGIPTADAIGEMGPQTSLLTRVNEAIKAGINTQNLDYRCYVFNIRTKKVHDPECGHVTGIHENNRQDIVLTLDELLAYYPDYSPCGSCKPYVKPG